ncbi:helix-turn-helix domain-containing protein [Halobaculum sp. CBA1158]|uniref:helix-turn-helix domain-containing protein n=1 Tax=Halobaculum sp. CBA1158 TaxID=2904243 RepID=UPI001F1C2505|nr:helix-turn-helix domain-containing protein [Halobaculum sp. CBA1158]UIP00516.1 helix-turn-helix domain-containing protein [Halobaculum sp. CBA1158]
MPDAMTELLRKEMQCENLLDCFHGLSELDKEVFRLLVEGDDPMTVDEVAAEIDRERTTAYRSVRRLQEADIVERKQVSQEGGSYYHVFTPRDADEIADAMQRTLNDFYAKMGQLIGEFREKYATVEEHGGETGTSATQPDT